MLRSMGSQSRTRLSNWTELTEAPHPQLHLDVPRRVLTKDPKPQHLNVLKPLPFFFSFRPDLTILSGHNPRNHSPLTLRNFLNSSLYFSTSHSPSKCHPLKWVFAKVTHKFQGTGHGRRGKGRRRGTSAVSHTASP